MNNKLFIPQKLKVGFQKRNDTYTKKLAYIIYYDEKGNLRKEISWEGWRDKKIPAQEIENKPHSGFVINKDVQRSSEWFGSGRNMIRIYDDRGMEFEITCDNLVFILMTTNCHKRGLEGEFVYAWQGKELILLPTACEEYKTSIKFSSLKTEKISKKDLIPGCSYKSKDMEDFIYLGFFDCHFVRGEYSNGYKSYLYSNYTEKQHAFINNKNKITFFKGLTKIASKISNSPVSNYAVLMDLFNNSKYSNLLSGLELGKIIKSTELIPKTDDKFDFLYDGDLDIRSFLYLKEKDDFIEYELKRTQKYDEKTNICTILGYKIKKSKKYNLIKVNSINSIEKFSYDRFSNPRKIYSLEEIEKMDFCRLNVVLQNGAKVPMEKWIDVYDFNDDDYDDDYESEDDEETIEKLKTLQVIY